MALLYLMTLFSATRIEVTNAGNIQVCKEAIGYPNYFMTMHSRINTWDDECCELRTGEYDMDDLGRGGCPDNDEISEVKIPDDCQVTLYEHSGWRGDQLTLERWSGGSHGVVSLTDNRYKHFNDETSSIVVRCDYERWIYPGVKGAQFCADENRNHDLCCEFEAGEYNINDLGRDGCPGNDKTTGIEVDQGCQVTVYEHSGWRGKSWTLEGPGRYHDEGHFDEATISSMKITCKTFDGLWGTPEPTPFPTTPSPTPEPTPFPTTPSPTPKPTLAPEQSTCDTFTGFASRCDNEEFAGDRCMFNVKTQGGTCAQYCEEQGSTCLRAMDNLSSGPNRGACVLNWEGHDRQSTENNGCNQRWNDQICVCERAPLEGTCAYFGGLGDGDICCHSGCSQCGGKNCSKSTIFGIFTDMNTSAANCCHVMIREEQNYCEKPGDAPCVIRQTPAPTPQPTRQPSLEPSATPSRWPTSLPTPTPTLSPSLLPTSLPTPTPTLSPSLLPTSLLTPTPSRSPSLLPTSLPTPKPTLRPTAEGTCAYFGGLGDGDICCHSGCSQCGGSGCSRATIFGKFTDLDTSATKCCHGKIREGQKYCEKHGDAPCMIPQTPTPTPEPTPLPTSNPSAAPTTPAPTSICTRYGGIGEDSVCCNSGCSQCGGSGCSRATIFGIFTDMNTSAANCCHGHIRKEQKQCEKDGDAPCLIQTSEPTTAPTTGPTPKRQYPGDSDEPESPCMGRKKRQCKSDVCAWASIPAHESVGEVHNDSDTVGEFCVDLSNFHCGLITTRKSCERSDCRWRAGRKGMEDGCMEKVECGTIKTRKLCKSSGCKWVKNEKAGKYIGICHEDN